MHNIVTFFVVIDNIVSKLEMLSFISEKEYCSEFYLDEKMSVSFIASSVLNILSNSLLVAST